MDRERQREKYRLYYAANKDRINKRRKELRALRSQAQRNIGILREQSNPTPSNTLPEVHCARQEPLWNATRMNITTNNNESRVPGYSSNVNYSSHPDVNTGGDVVLADSVLPEYMVRLITSNDEKSKEFQNMIRTYNNHFAFTTIGMQCDEEYQCRNQGIYTVRVQGQIHHFLNDLVPIVGQTKMAGLQFYFYDPEHQASNRVEALPRLDYSTVRHLVEMMDMNPYSQFLKRASMLDNLEQYEIFIRTDPGLDQRRYNKPTSSEVAGIWMEDDSNADICPNPRDIRVYSKSGRSYKVKYFYGCYDPLQYVLMFPNGEPGWHGGIAKVQRGHNGVINLTSDAPSTSDIIDCSRFEEIIDREEEAAAQMANDDASRNRGNELVSTTSRKRKTVSCREYYVYKLQQREGDTSYILRFGRLLQQYVIDNYVKLETMRLDYFRHNQKKIRIEHYQGVVDSVEAGIQKGAKVGTRVYLPRTFIGGPRDMRDRYLDSMALVAEFGRPDIFLTMTCNPNWPEIKDLLQPGEEPHNRPDLLARVFKAKLTVLLNMIMKEDFFGQIESVVHVVEFQKRGLPHAHILIILKPEFKYLTPEAYDRIVCAELPDKDADPYLFGIVVKHMMHGPCGDLKPNNVCMKNGRCKNHYPKDYQQHTVHGKGSYPIYRRRNDGRTTRVRGHTLDNRWVIPYNPILIAMFNCHMNVEVCCDIRAVKYLYKYIHKGHDKIKFRIAPENSQNIVDEISNFQDARWVSPVEAAWRLFGFPISGMYPSVFQLQVHLPNFQSIRFEDDVDLEDVLQNEQLKKTMLTEFFLTNSIDPEARALNLLYKDFPKHYVWDNGTRVWTKRKQRTVVGRLCTVKPVENERYYLRILLSNVRCPTSFEYLLTVDGRICTTFWDAAYTRGLLHNDDDVDKTMEEASIYGMPAELRRLFATLLHYCRPADPRGLFDRFYSHMAEDFHRCRTQTHLSTDEILYKVLQGINDTLESLGRDVNEFNLASMKYIATDVDCYTREYQSEMNIPVPDEDIHAITKLNAQQKII